MDMSRNHQESDTKTATQQEPSLLPEVSKKLAAGASAVALRRLQRNHQRQRGGGKMKALAQSQQAFDDAGRSFPKMPAEKRRRVVAMSLTQGPDESVTPRVFSGQQAQLLRPGQAALIADLQRGKIQGGALLGSLGRRGPYRVRQASTDGESCAHKLSAHDVLDSKQLSRISGLIDQHQALRLAQPSHFQDLSLHEDTGTVPDYSHQATSHYASKDKAAVFENSKFQSYTELQASAAAGGAGRLALQLGTSRYAAHQGSYELVGESREAVPRVEAGWQQRDVRESLSSLPVGPQELGGSPETAGKAGAGLDPLTSEKESPLGQTRGSLIAPKEPSNFDSLHAYTDTASARNAQPRGQAVALQHDQGRQPSTCRDPLQKLPLLPSHSPYGTASVSRRSRHGAPATGRTRQPHEHVTTPLQNSKILIKVTSSAPGAEAVGDYGHMQSRLPELGRANATASFRHKSSHMPKSTAASTQHKTPREQQLGVLQLAMWQRVQKIGMRGSATSQAEHLQLASSRPAPHEKGQDGVSSLPDDVRLLSGPSMPSQRRKATIAGGDRRNEQRERLRRSQVQSEGLRPQDEEGGGGEADRGAKMKGEREMGQRSVTGKGEGIKIAGGGTQALAQLLRGKKEQEGTESSSYGEESEDGEARAGRRQANTFALKGMASLGGADAEPEDGDSGSDDRPVVSPESIQMVSNLGGKLLLSVKEKYAHSRKARRAEKKRARSQVDAVTGLNLNSYLMKKGFSRMIKLLERLGKERKANDAVEHSLVEAAQGCKLDLSEAGLQQLVDEMNKLIARKVRKKRQEERGLAGYIAEDCCHIALKSQKFMNSTQQDGGARALDNMIDAAAVEAGRHHECSHSKGEDDIQDECIGLYKKLLVFRSHLQHQLKQEPPKDQLVQGILEHIQEDSKQDHRHLRIFQDQDQLAKLLNDPIMDIIEPDDVHQKELAILTQGSPQKARNQEKVATRVPGSVIYETKNQQTLSLSAKHAIHQVQQKMKKDQEQSQVPEEAPESDSDGGDEQRKAAKAAEARRKLARKLLLAGAGAKAAGRQIQSYVDVQELIRDNQDRDEQLAAHDPNSEESAAIHRRLASKLMPNVQTVYRLDLLKQMQAQEIQDSMKAERPLHQKLNLEEMDEDDVGNRKHRLGGHDEVISSKKNEYIDVTDSYWKRMKHMEHLIRPISSTSRPSGLRMLEPKAIDIEVATNNLEVTSQRSHEPDETLYQQNLLNSIEAHDRFYNKAKQEVAGNNQPPTQESEFFVHCQTQRLLAFPIFKCLNNNAMNFLGQPLSLGYCKAFASMIRSNVEAQNHLLSIHLDDCNMKDEEFSVILDAILHTKHFYPSIQSIKYSNNEMGKASVAKLAELMQVDHEQPAFQREIYCLKELVLCNVAFRRENELRELVKVLSGPAGANLQKLKLQQINLNQGDYLTQQEMLGHISTLVETTQNLRCLSLCQCNLGAKSLFRDEDEKLVLNTSFVKLFDSILNNDSCLSALDLSGNPISPQIPDREATVRDIVEKIKQLIEQKPSLASLNLSGLMLTSALTALMPALKENSTLCYFNISNNGLLPYDQDWCLRELGILTADQPDSVLSQTLLLQSDRCFHNAFVRFRSQHLKDQYIAKMCKKEEEADSQDEGANSNDGNAGEDAGHSAQEATALYASMVNSAIMKRVQERRHLAKKVNVETDLGGEKIHRDTQAGGTEGIDSVVVQRQARNPELIFNTLQTSYRRAGAQSPSLECYDFQRPWSWEYVSQDAERELQGGPGLDLEGAQYLSICIDSKRISNHFAEVHDKQVLRVLKKCYGLDCLQSRYSGLEEGSHIRDGLLVFGTITNWRVFQMLKLYKVTTALVAASESDQNALAADVFDEVNNSLATTFKTIKSTVWSTYQSLLKNERAQTVGITDDDFHVLSAAEKEELLQSRCFTYSTFVCRPGKHSIFVYDIESDRLFFKGVVVEQPLPWAIGSGRWSPLFLAITPPPPDSLTLSPGPQVALPRASTQHAGSGKHLQRKVPADTRALLLQQAALNDISPSNLHISEYFQNVDDLRRAFDSLRGHYTAILALYNDLLSESPEDFPRVSSNSLLEFVKRAKLLPKSRTAPEQPQNTMIGAVGRSLISATKGTAPDENDIRQFDAIDRATLVKVLMWLCKQQYQHNYWPSQFGKYLEEFIVPLTQQSDYWKVKDALKEDADVQELVQANAEHLLALMRTASHFRGFYVGFSVDIAHQLLINGELEALKPEPVKEPDAKKKKGKKGAKKAEPAPASPPKKPPPQTVPIEPSSMSKFFHQSLQIVVQEQRQTDGMHGHIKSLSELAEFFYRIAAFVYEEANVQTMQKVMTVAFKAAEMTVTFAEPV